MTALAWAKVGVVKVVRGGRIQNVFEDSATGVLMDWMRGVGETEEYDHPHHW